MPFIVVYDACVLHPAPLRDLLVRLGHTGLCQVKWSRRILDECFHGILRHRPDLTSEQLASSRKRLEEAIFDVEVTGYEEFIEGITGLPDPSDRHVVAAAVRCGAQVIVTSNLKDFPKRVLARYGMEAQSPDDFVLDLIDLNEGAVLQVIRAQAAVLKNPPKRPSNVLDSLHHNGLVRSVARLRELLDG
ncbi:PIN domain-containing protein [Melittangium boletus]|uniref:PIN domain-containing protein n=1 Tax=Melittangium boletus DSM 14713 TaxID=1294270 RepID=A0A250IF34_9BACT|nr:PIN domain-containing protein [Melittangium boletus]ATB29757.1 PIN domain-containing protein [Melittangium boletus DSM 14713]